MHNPPVKWAENEQKILTKALTLPNSKVAEWGGNTTKTKNAELLHNIIITSVLTPFHHPSPPPLK